MNPSSIIHAKIITPKEVIPDGSVVIQNSKITFVGAFDSSHIKDKEQTIDCQGLTLIPGLIDLQINGMMGVNFSSPPLTDDDLNLAASEVAKRGTTSFLATVISSPLDQMEESIERLSSFIKANPAGPIIGLHIEGPFINKKCGGAHNIDHIISPSIEVMDQFINVGAGTIKLVTLAPELPGALDLIDHLNAKGVLVSIGHSHASVDVCKRAIAHGAKCFTHIFNAMGPIHQRAPGPAIAGLIEDEVYVSVIGDGRHLDPSILKLIVSSKNLEKMILVSDLVPFAGLKEDMIFSFAGRKVVSRDGVGLIYEDGKEVGLAGSTRSLIEVIGIFKESTGLPLEKVIKMITITPARLLGLDKSIGSIEEGKDADLVLLGPDGGIQKVFKRGKAIFSS